MYRDTFEMDRWTNTRGCCSLEKLWFWNYSPLFQFSSKRWRYCTLTENFGFPPTLPTSWCGAIFWNLKFAQKGLILTGGAQRHIKNIVSLVCALQGLRPGHSVPESPAPFYFLSHGIVPHNFTISSGGDNTMGEIVVPYSSLRSMTLSPFLVRYYEGKWIHHFF